MQAFAYYTKEHQYAACDGIGDDQRVGRPIDHYNPLKYTAHTQTGYNLDGGGSSTMVFNGVVVNKPTNNGGISERRVSDIVYI